MYEYTVIPLEMTQAGAEIPKPDEVNIWTLLQTEKKGLFLVCTWSQAIPV